MTKPHPHRRLRWLAPIWIALAVASMVAVSIGWWPLASLSAAALVLCLAPLVLASRYRVVLPLPFAVSLTAFIVASLIAGEVFNAYERLWWWDIALHGSSAIALGLVGFLFIYMLFNGDSFAAPPAAVAFIAYTFAVSLGVLWEIFEYFVDLVLGTSMQKDGLRDTMSDLIVDTVGAAVGALFGYSYLKGQATGIPGRLIDEFVAMNRHLYAKARQRRRK